MTDLRGNLLAALRAHPPSYTKHGPMYCHPCSDRIGNWVEWTPEHVADETIALWRRGQLTEAAADPWCRIAMDERDDARDLAAALEAELARVRDAVNVGATPALIAEILDEATDG